MTDPRFGRLTQVDVRMGWAFEDREFTPWLSENLDRLAEALALPLELVEREHQVGRFSLDLLAESDGHRVVIENQFGTADHRHLGQLLTYAAGTEADLVIWLAESFHEEHLAALEWLNESTMAEVGFFAVELALMQIADSPLAPLFRVVARPNSWRKATRQHTEEVTVDWSFDEYIERLGVDADRVRRSQELYDALVGEVERRQLPWKAKFNKKYVAFQRPGGYNIITLWPHGYSEVHLHVKMPEPLDVLGQGNVFPSLSYDWIDAWRETAWTVDAHPTDPTEFARAAVELAVRWNPEEGPLPPRR